MNCPNCGEECWREHCDVGVGIIYGPYGCYCGWSEWEQYNQLEGSGGVQPDGSYVDTYGGIYPAGSPIAILNSKQKQ